MANGKVSVYTCDEIPKRCFQYFHDMKKKKERCDVTFQVGDESIFAHSIVVMAVIPYFRDLLSEKSKTQAEDIRMPDVEPSALKCLIEFAYTCELRIDQDNAMSLLSAACYLRVDDVREACSDFLADNLEPENVFSVREVAHSLDCTDLVSHIDSYVKRNFHEIAETKQFLECPVVYLKDVTGQNDLCVYNEEKVVEAVLKWVKTSPEVRKTELPELLTKIRISQIKPEYLTRLVEAEEIIRTSVLCRDLIDDAKSYQLWPELRKDSYNFSTEPRKCSISWTLQEERDKICVYNLSGTLKLAMECFNLVEGKWYIKASKGYVIDEGSAAELGKKMYYLYWGYTFEYDPTCDSYQLLQNVPTARCYVGVTSFEDKLYVFGGQNGSPEKNSCRASNAVECYNRKKDEWAKMKPMTSGRWGICALTLEEHIFIFGGRDCSSVLDYAEKYDPVTDKWRKMSPMLRKRSFAGAATQNGKIYVCGGLATLYRTDTTATVEVYDPKKDCWNLICPMNTARYNFSLLSCQGKLYAVGGYDDNNIPLHYFDIYEPENDAWRVGPSKKSTLVTSSAITM